MKAILEILINAILFFLTQLLMDWSSDKPITTSNVLISAAFSILYGLVMYPTLRFINRRFNKGKSTAKDVTQ